MPPIYGKDIMIPMAGAEVDLPPTDPPSDEDRRRVINLLRTAGSKLGLEEVERRMDAALHVGTRGDLALLVWDLPAPAGGTEDGRRQFRVSAWRSAAFKAHATAYGLVNAIAFQRRLDEQRRATGFAPAVRIGINAGDAVEEEGDVLGATVNLASRVTAAAQPNEILITEVVADRVDSHIHLRDEGLREMKGLERRVHVLSVSWQ
jgi:class 3 adenylate cyclase